MRWELDTNLEAHEPIIDNSAQQAVINLESGRHLVVGTAGSGKTTTVIAAVAERLGIGLPPAQILVLTYGKSAVRTFREKLAGQVRGTVLPYIGTFHALAYLIVMGASTSIDPDSRDLPKLLSGAEEDARIRDLISGILADSQDSPHTIDWPVSLRSAASTASFAREVRNVIARLKELHLSGPDLIAMGKRLDRPEWVVAGHIAANDAEVMALENVMDYNSLLLEAIALTPTSPVIAKITHIYVDEYQEVGPLHRELLAVLAHKAQVLVAAGNPHESVFGFRGSETGMTPGFVREFAHAQVHELTDGWRFGREIGAAATAPFGASDQSLVSYGNFFAATGAVFINKYSSRTTRAAFVAEGIFNAHMAEGVSWKSMAVIGRARSDIPLITRALNRAGVPVVVATDEIALKDEPAVQALLGFISLAARPHLASAADVSDLLTGPIGRCDASELRRLGRALRTLQPNIGSPELIRELIVGAGSPGLIFNKLGELGARIKAITGLVAKLRSEIASHKPVTDILWTAWSGGDTYPHGWPQRLQQAALAHSGSAHHDLDSIMALFDTAARFSERANAGVDNFLTQLNYQNLPAEPVSARGLRADAVQVMTVHQSKGREWDRVWVVGLEEGIWPNLVPRGSLLRAEEIGAGDAISGANPVALLREERNLFYVASTRAREVLTLTCIDQGSEGGDQPSRFIRDVQAGGVVPHTVSGYPKNRASWSGLSADLRRTLSDPQASNSLKSTAGQILAQMGDRVGPSTWWGLAPLTQSSRPVRPKHKPIHMSGSSLDSLLQCPLKWFLDREVKAHVARGSATAFGSIVHAIAEFVAKGELEQDSAKIQELISDSWRSLAYEAGWQSSADLSQAYKAAELFLDYHNLTPRVFKEAEGRYQTSLTVTTPGGGQEEIELSGILDRVEIDESGRLVAIDFKNVKTPPTNAEIAENGQLGIYQLLLRDQQSVKLSSGLSTDLGDQEQAQVGAALVQLRVDASKPKIQPQEVIDFAQSPTWIEVKLGEAAEIIRTESFTPRVNPSCRYCPYRAVCPTTSSDIFSRDVIEDGDSGDH
jgi:superfamily I DNA/RNA helicase/RecB family exonuclease